MGGKFESSLAQGVMTKVRYIYISGPMEGYEKHNIPAFNSMAAFLRSIGYIVVNPVNILVDESFMITNKPNRQDYYRKDFRALTLCTDIMMLKGWNMSHGAQLERLVAIEMGLRVHYEDEIEDGELRER